MTDWESGNLMERAITRDEILNILRRELPYLKDRYGVEIMAVYGSFAKNSQAEGSDIDILVQLSKPLGLDFIHLAYHLEETLGREVDLNTFESLRRSATNPRRAHITRDIERTLIHV
jgi:predicted nucleotidyltransferase